RGSGGRAGRRVGERGEGKRKDVRNAGGAPPAAAAWAHSSGPNRGQILFYIAETLAARADEFGARIAAMIGSDPATGRREVDAAIARLFSYAAWADKYDGAVHQVPIRGVTLAMNEAVGVLGIACPEQYPLLGFVSLVAPRSE